MKNNSTYVLLLLLMAMLSGCGEQPAGTDIPQPEPSVATADVESVTSDNNKILTARQTQMWAASCGLCHVNGNAGAPVVGIAEHWQPRLAKGMQTLLQHTLEGFNSMPPLGYCMACEKQDFSAMILFMSKNHADSGGTAATGVSE